MDGLVATSAQMYNGASSSSSLVDSRNQTPDINIHALYPSHADLGSTSFSSLSAKNPQYDITKNSSSTKIQSSQYSNYGHQSKVKLSNQSRPKSLSMDSKLKQATHKVPDIHSFPEINSGSKSPKSSRIKLRSDYSKYESNKTTRSFTQQPFQASIEIADQFHAELERLYSESSKEQQDFSSLPSELKLEDVLLQCDNGELFGRENGHEKAKRAGRKSVVLSDEIVVVDDDDQHHEQDIYDHLNHEQSETTDSEIVPPPPSDDLPSDDTDSATDSYRQMSDENEENNNISQHSVLFPKPIALPSSSTVIHRKISSGKAKSLSCMDINVMETWNDREVEVNGLDSQQRPISMYAASSTDRPAENGLSRSDGFESTGNLTRVAGSSTNGYLNPTIERNSTLSYTYNNYPPPQERSSIFDLFKKPGRKMSNAASVDQLPQYIDASCATRSSQKDKSFSFSRTFGRSKKKKNSGHIWDFFDPNDLGSAFRFSLNDHTKFTSKSSADSLTSAQASCATCNRTFDQARGESAPFNRIAKCQECGVAVHDEDACRGPVEREECGSIRNKKLNVAVGGSKRRLSGRNSYSGGNSGLLGASGHSAKSLSNLTADPSSSTNNNNNNHLHFNFVTQSSNLYSLEQLQHMHNGSILEEDEKDSAVGGNPASGGLDDSTMTSASHHSFHSTSSHPHSAQGSTVNSPYTSTPHASFKHGRSISMLTGSSSNTSTLEGDRSQTSGFSIGLRPSSSSGRNNKIGGLDKRDSIGSIRTKSTPDLTLGMGYEKMRQSLESINDSVDSINAQKAGILIEPNSSFLNPEFPELVDMETRWDKTVPDWLVKGLQKYSVQEQSAIHELLTTEHNFLRELDLVELYIDNINHRLDWRQWNVTKQMGTHAASDVSSYLFGAPEVRTTLAALSKRLLKKLTERRSWARREGPNGEEPQYVMDVSAVLYSHFCDRDNIDSYIKAFHRLTISQDTAKKFYDDARENMAEFRKFVNECSKNPAMKRRTLLDTRGAIIQRPHKYPALISALIKSAQKELDAEKTQSAAEKLERLNSCQKAVDTILTQIDKLLREHQMSELLKDIWSKTDSKPLTLEMRDPSDRRSEVRLPFEKRSIEAMKTRLLKPFTVKLTTEGMKDKVKNVLILVMEDCLILLEIKDPNAPQYMLLSVPKVVPVMMAETMIISAGETLRDEQVHLIDKKYPSLSTITLKSRTEKDDFFKICNSIKPGVGTSSSFTAAEGHLGSGGFGKPKNHSFKSTSTPAQRSNSQSKLQGSQNSNSILNYTPSIVTTTDSSGTGGGGGSIGNSSSFKSHDSRSTTTDTHTLELPELVIQKPSLSNSPGFNTSSMGSLNDSFISMGDQVSVFTERGAEEVEEGGGSSSQDSLGVKVEACYDQLNQLLDEIFCHKSLEQGESLKQSISSLMSDLSQLKKSTTLMNQSPLHDPTKSNPQNYPVSRSESCRMKLALSANESELLSAFENGGGKRPLSFTPADSNSGFHKTEGGGGKSASASGGSGSGLEGGRGMGMGTKADSYQSTSAIFDTPQKRTGHCSCGSDASEYIAELEKSILCKNEYLHGAKDYISRLESEVEKKNSELMKSKKDTLAIQLDSLVKESKIKSIRQNLALNPPVTSSSSADHQENVLESSCGCDGDDMCHFHHLQINQKRISNHMNHRGSIGMDNRDSAESEHQESFPKITIREIADNESSLSPSLSESISPPVDNLKNIDSASLTIKASPMMSQTVLASPPDIISTPAMTSSPQSNASNFIYPSSAQNASQPPASTMTTVQTSSSNQVGGIKRTQPVQQKKSPAQELKQQLPSKLMLSSTSNEGAKKGQMAFSSKKQQPQTANQNQAFDKSGAKKNKSSGDLLESKDLNLYNRRRGGNIQKPKVEVEPSPSLAQQQQQYPRRKAKSEVTSPMIMQIQPVGEHAHMPIIRTPSGGASDLRFFKQTEDEKATARKGGQNSSSSRKTSLKSVFGSRSRKQSEGKDGSNNIEPDSVVERDPDATTGPEVFLL